MATKYFVVITILNIGIGFILMMKSWYLELLDRYRMISWTDELKLKVIRCTYTSILGHIS